MYDEALALARRTPCDPRTLARAARDHADAQPVFAVEAGMLALHWLVAGYGYEINGTDVWTAYANTMRAAERQENVAETHHRVRTLVAGESTGARSVAKILGRVLGLSEDLSHHSGAQGGAPARQARRLPAKGSP